MTRSGLFEMKTDAVRQLEGGPERCWPHPPQPWEPSPLSLVGAARYWLNLGLISFGGPPARCH